MNHSSIILKLETQSKHPVSDVRVLKERFQSIRKKISQPILEPISNLSYLMNLKKKLQTYKNEQENLTKSIEKIKSSWALIPIENKVKKQEVFLKNLEIQNSKLSKAKNFQPSKKTQQDPVQELGLLKSEISRLEGLNDETQFSINEKSLKIQDLSAQLAKLKSICPSRYCFKSASQAREYLKSLQNSSITNLSKSLKYISDLEQILTELKDQETILRSTLIKKQQQHRLITTLGYQLDGSNSEDSQFDVKFFYKPTLRYLYI